MVAGTRAGHVLSYAPLWVYGPPVDGWLTRELTGHAVAACSCGLTISGPAGNVGPLVKQHARQVLPLDDWPAWLRPE
jgi:hypothetical protein